MKYGLPDWRSAAYYVRKYRKMGNLEVSIIVGMIATLGHYLAWWAAYLEKYYEMVSGFLFTSMKYKPEGLEVNLLGRI